MDQARCVRAVMREVQLVNRVRSVVGEAMMEVASDLWQPVLGCRAWSPSYCLVGRVAAEVVSRDPLESGCTQGRWRRLGASTDFYDGGMGGAVAKILRILPMNPIVVRLVQSGSVRTRHLLIRAGYLGILIVVLLAAMLGSVGTLRELAQQGATAFALVSYGQVLLICLLAPVFMAGAIAQESNPQTWDVLLTSPLTSLQIVLGNLFGRLFFVLALLLGSLPLFAVTRLFGGVPGSAIVQSYAIAAATALLVGAIAITLSVTRSAGRRAVFIFYSCVVLFLFATFAADLAFVQPVAPGSDTVFTTVMTPLNPLLTLRVLLDSASYVPRDFAGTGHLWLMRVWLGSPVATQLWLFTLISGVLVVYSTLRVRLLGRALVGAAGSARALSGREPRRVWANPVAWREMHLRGSSIGVQALRWGFVAAALAVGLVILLLTRSGTLTLEESRLSLSAVLGAEVLIVVLTALNLSATAVSREREDRSLDILLTTPIQPGQYISGKLRGLIQYLLPLMLVPCITLGLAALFVTTRGFGKAMTVTVQESVGTSMVDVPMVLPESAIALPLVLVSFTALSVMVGLQWSVRSKGTIGSVVAAAAIMIAIGGTVGLCGLGLGRSVPFLGAGLNAASPMNLVLAAVHPAPLIEGSLDNPVSRIVSLLGGAGLATIVYFAVVYGLHSSIKANFMATVRRLAGTA